MQMVSSAFFTSNNVNTFTEFELEKTILLEQNKFLQAHVTKSIIFNGVFKIVKIVNTCFVNFFVFCKQNLI